MDRFQYNLAGIFLWWPSTKVVQAVMICQKTCLLGVGLIFPIYLIEDFLSFLYRYYLYRKLKKSSCKKLLDRVQCNLAGMLLWWPSTKLVQALMICQKNMATRLRGLFSVYICLKNFKILLVRNNLTNFNITWQECCFGDSLPRLFKQSLFVKKHGC